MGILREEIGFLVRYDNGGKAEKVQLSAPNSHKGGDLKMYKLGGDMENMKITIE